jgi:hypothetical protein
VSIKLGDHTVVLVKSVEDWNDRDDYGNPVKDHVYRQVHWCQARSERVDVVVQREDGTRPKGRPYARISIPAENEFGDSKTRRLRILGRVVGL